MIIPQIIEDSYNLLNLYNEGIIEVDVSKPVQKKIELKKRTLAPEPTELKLIIITCDVFLDCNLNLEIIARQLELDDQIIGKKLLDVTSDGPFKIKPKPKPKPKKPSKNNSGEDSQRRDFSNQCTILVRPPGFTKDINLKVFGNGKIIICGSLSTGEGDLAIDIFRKKIKPLEYDYQILHDTKFSDFFTNVRNYLKYIEKNYIIFLKLFSIYGVNINLQLDLVLNKKLVRKYQIKDMNGKITEIDLHKQSLEDLIKQNIIIKGSPKDCEDYLKLIQVFNICHLYYNNTHFLIKLNQSDDRVINLFNDLYNFQKKRLPVTFDIKKLDCDQNPVIKINNYNTMFYSMYYLDRELFAQLLSNKYKDIIASVKFEPCKYQGINAKYISRIHCTSDCKSTGGKKTSSCPCKEISFLIFQAGKIIITGGRSWDQMIDGYNVITNILKDEYNSIMIEQKALSSDSSGELPLQIIKQSPTGEKNIYLNKKQQIIENPRNYFLLKKFELLHLYL